MDECRPEICNASLYKIYVIGVELLYSVSYFDQLILSSLSWVRCSCTKPKFNIFQNIIMPVYEKVKGAGYIGRLVC